MGFTGREQEPWERSEQESSVSRLAPRTDVLGHCADERSGRTRGGLPHWRDEKGPSGGSAGGEEREQTRLGDGPGEGRWRRGVTDGRPEAGLCDLGLQRDWAVP